MITVDQARARIAADLKPLGTEIVGLGDALGRVLGEDLVARRPQPPFAVSAMDGYAVRAGDVETLPARLRIAGEAAPLMFTALGNVYWNTNLNQPTAALPLLIYEYAKQPYEQLHQQAWTGALVLITMIMVTVILFRWLSSRGTIKGAS